MITTKFPMFHSSFRIPEKLNLRFRVKFMPWLMIVIQLLIGMPTPTLAHSDVTLDVSGVVRPNCSFVDLESTTANDGTFASASTVSFVVDASKPLMGQARDDQGDVAQLKLNLSCNTPFRLSLKAMNGALLPTNQTGKSLSDSIAQSIDYNLDLNVSTEQSESPVHVQCGSRLAALSTGQCEASSNRFLAIGAHAGLGHLKVSLAHAGKLPARGNYQDTVVIALSLE